MEPAEDSLATLRLHAEELAVRTASVLDRDVLVARDVVETNVRFDLTLLAESVRIVEGPVAHAVAIVPPIDEPQRLVIRLSRERAFVALRVVEYERVSIGTRKTTDVAHVSASLAHEELAVERFEGERS